MMSEIPTTVRPLRYGRFELELPIIEAALSGYSDAPMRRLAKRFGSPLALCEVFLDRFVVEVSKRRKSRFYLTVAEDDHPAGAQIMGSEPDEMAAAAQRLVEFGFDIIDLNFACPVRKVLAHRRGGALMNDPIRALAIVERVRSALPDSVPLSVKLRKGFDESPESEEKFFTLLDGLLDRSVAGITLHGRTVREAYTGTADWEFVRRVKLYLTGEKQRPDFFVIGSGDLFSAVTAQKRLAESGVDGLALARGIIGNPWLFREIEAVLRGRPLPFPPSLSEQKEVILDHWRSAEALYGPNRTVMIMRKFLIRYAVRHPEAETLKRLFATFRTPAELEEILKKYDSTPQ